MRSVTGDIEHSIVAESGGDYDVAAAIEEVKREMLEAADALEFERAAALRDELRELQSSVPTPCKIGDNKVESAAKSKSRKKNK